MSEKLTAIEVHKFGGTSLASADHFRAIPSIVANDNAAIVVSATAGTTNQLQQLLTNALHHQCCDAGIAALKQTHVSLVQDLIADQATKQELIKHLENDADALGTLLDTAKLLGNYNAHIQDKVLGFGELWSARILAATINQSTPTLFIDASKVLITYHKHNQLHIDWEASAVLLQQSIEKQAYDHLVITGFIATNAAKQFLTLGRNGSDYSAAIFAKLLNATKLVIWTDVDGIYSADPNKVRSAFPLTSLSYEEALELAYFGAKVIHPQTIFPAIHKNIPIYVKNSAKPHAPGTVISSQNQPGNFLIKGLSCIDDTALINIEGSGMAGVSGTAARVFQVLQQGDISVILISQASSEHSICLAIKQDQAAKAEQLLAEEFAFEIEQGLIKRISVDNHCAILAAVGDDMVGRQGIASKVCNTLTKANVNIRAIAQGSSERNISVVVNRSDINKALRAVHARFYLSRKTISIGLIGPGQVGKTLLKQIQATFLQLQQKHHVNLSIRGILNSKQMLLDHHSIDLLQWETQFSNYAQATNIDTFIEHIAADDMPHAVIIDCTASQEIANLYPQFITHGLHIVTPNKRANSGDYTFYKNLHALAQQKNRFYLYETTVCAGLPVIKSLQDIIATGDEVLSIQGIVSGTLSYIFNQLASGQAFSAVVLQAKQAGYTEPDPRDDLSGMDVARKFVCLARELGHDAKLEDITVTNLVPETLRTVNTNEFLQRLPEHDNEIHAILAPIFAKNQSPCYVGTIAADGRIQIAIEGFAHDHPFSRMAGTDNMIIFKTNRYHQQPLVIQGPGAGTEVTAAGIFSDLLRLVTALD